MKTRTDNANQAPADGSQDPEEAAIVILSQGNTNQDTCSQEHLQIDTVSQRQVTMDDEGLRPGARGITTQTIPSRCVRSPRRLLELLKTKYGQDGYNVEMRHNVYTVVTRDGKGKLSQASLLELSW